MHTYRQNDEGKWEVGYYIMARSGNDFATSKWIAVSLYDGDLSQQQAETAVNYLNGGPR